MSQQSRSQDRGPRHEVEVDEQGVADIVDLAREQIHDRTRPLGRQRRLAEPVHLAMDLAAERGCQRADRLGQDRTPELGDQA